jgi:hypothetical protein
MGQKNNLEQFIEESISNIRDDRDTVKFLLTDLLAAKYVETLQRSNEQLVKLTSLIQKNSKGTDGLTAEDKRDLFDLINGSDEDRETG